MASFIVVIDNADGETVYVNPDRALKQVDLDHIKNLHLWAAKAAARGDFTSSERFQRAAHSTFERAVYEQRKENHYAV